MAKTLWKRDRAILGGVGQPVGRADDLAGPHAAAGEQGAGDVRPVVAAGVLVDLGRAAELAPDDDRHVLVEPARVEVVDQGRQGLIELREVRAALAEVVPVEVPAAEGQRHAADPASTSRRAIRNWSLQQGPPSSTFFMSP